MIIPDDTGVYVVAPSRNGRTVHLSGSCKDAFTAAWNFLGKDI
jgi:hypothetical protein